MAAQFLRSVQLRLGVYFQSIDTMNAAEQDWLIPPPNLVDLLVSIRVQSWVPSIVPQVPALPLAPVAPPATPATPPVVIDTEDDANLHYSLKLVSPLSPSGIVSTLNYSKMATPFPANHYSPSCETTLSGIILTTVPPSLTNPLT